MSKKVLLAAVAVASLSLVSFTSVNKDSDKKEVSLKNIISYENLITADKEVFTRDEKTFSDKFNYRRQTWTPTSYSVLSTQSNVIDGF
jgi:hypothetical protein